MKRSIGDGRPRMQGRWFLPAMVVIVGAALMLPMPEAGGGGSSRQAIGRMAVAAAFLIQGLTLPTQALRDAVRQWRLHAAVQVQVFIVFPLIGIALDALWGPHLAPDLRSGFLFLCILPSTVVMSVPLTAMAGGNTGAAIVNAALSNMVGVFATPLLAVSLLAVSGATQAGSAMVRDVALLLLIPLLVGQAIRYLSAAAFADRHSAALGNVVSLLILFIVFGAFSETRRAGLWSLEGARTLVPAVVGVLSLLGLALVAATLAARLLKLAPPEQVVLLFCGSQKSLAAGVPLAQVLFGHHPGLGLILLPVMICHPLQLMICIALAMRRSRRLRPLPT